MIYVIYVIRCIVIFVSGYIVMYVGRCSDICDDVTSALTFGRLGRQEATQRLFWLQVYVCMMYVCVCVCMHVCVCVSVCLYVCMCV